MEEIGKYSKIFMLLLRELCSHCRSQVLNRHISFFFAVHCHWIVNVSDIYVRVIVKTTVYNA